MLEHFVYRTPAGPDLAPIDTSERNLRETCLVPFAQTIAATDPGLVIVSNNEVDKSRAQRNRLHYFASTPQQTEITTRETAMVEGEVMSAGDAAVQLCFRDVVSSARALHWI